MNHKNHGLLALLILLLTACAAPSGSLIGGDWQHLGNVQNGNIRAYVDKKSVKRVGQVVTFQDRKIVSNMNQASFLDTPRYKTALGEWEIHCANKTYRLNRIQLLNEQGNVIQQHQYTTMVFQKIQAASIAEKQWAWACR